MTRVILVLLRVSSSALAICSCKVALNAERSPMMRKQISLRCSFLTSRSKAKRNSFMRAETSSFGRRQFSLENANRVSTSTPSRAQVSTTALTASTPALCPATPLSRRDFAHRLLPSMIMATCRGRLSADTGISADTDPVMKSPVRPMEHPYWPCVSLASEPWRSNRHQVLFFSFQHLLDFGDVAICQLLDFFFALAHIVFADVFVLQQVFHHAVCIATGITDRDTTILGIRFRLLNHVFAGLFRQHRHRNTNQIAAGCGVQAKI